MSVRRIRPLTSVVVRCSSNTLATLAVVVLIAACSGPDGADVAGVTTFAPTTAATTSTTTEASTTTQTPTTAAPTTATTTTTTVTVPTPSPPYVPAESEVLRDRKELGGQFAQAVLTYDADATVETQLEDLRADFGFEPDDDTAALIEEAMVPNATNVGTVRYVQMGGNRPDRASLMVWVDQERVSSDGTTSTESRVVDVRVRLGADGWEVSRLASAGGPAVDRPADLSDLAASVADHQNISMPDSARWDIYAGHTTVGMLSRMIEVAEFTDYAVLVLGRGHPYRVFATESVSRHSVGQAMDVYEVGGQLVVDSRFEGSPTWNLARELYDRGTRSIGSPWAFDGFGGRSFTDDVHQDHLHITSL